MNKNQKKKAKEKFKKLIVKAQLAGASGGQAQVATMGHSARARAQTALPTIYLSVYGSTGDSVKLSKLVHSFCVAQVAMEKTPVPGGGSKKTRRKRKKKAIAAGALACVVPWNPVPPCMGR
jgi:hypothetical protein